MQGNGNGLGGRFSVGESFNFRRGDVGRVIHLTYRERH